MRAQKVIPRCDSLHRTDVAVYMVENIPKSHGREFEGRAVEFRSFEDKMSMYRGSS